MLKLLKRGKVKWFESARKRLLPGVLVPKVREVSHSWYEIEVLKAVPLCCTDLTLGYYRLLSQITDWSENHKVDSITWQAYLDAIEHRCYEPQVMEWLRKQHVPWGHFCHGDLTLENVLIHRDGGIYLIDPNPRLDFNSMHIDRGKIMFSLQYHRRFHSYWLTPAMAMAIRETTWSIEDRACLLTHIIRLQGHRSPSVTRSWLLEEFQQCVSL